MVERRIEKRATENRKKGREKEEKEKKKLLLIERRKRRERKVAWVERRRMVESRERGRVREGAGVDTEIGEKGKYCNRATEGENIILTIYA